MTTEEEMTTARYEKLALRRQVVFRQEKERIARRIIRALDSAQLTDEDGLRDFHRLHWMIGKELAVHYRREDRREGRARSIAQGIVEALDEMGPAEIIRIRGK
jgi:hypothetical protein